MTEEEKKQFALTGGKGKKKNALRDLQLSEFLTDTVYDFFSVNAHGESEADQNIPIVDGRKKQFSRLV